MLHHLPLFFILKWYLPLLGIFIFIKVTFINLVQIACFLFKRIFLIHDLCSTTLYFLSVFHTGDTFLHPSSSQTQCHLGSYQFATSPSFIHPWVLKTQSLKYSDTTPRPVLLESALPFFQLEMICSSFESRLLLNGWDSTMFVSSEPFFRIVSPLKSSWPQRILFNVSENRFAFRIYRERIQIWSRYWAFS